MRFALIWEVCTISPLPPLVVLCCCIVAAFRPSLNKRPLPQVVDQLQKSCGDITEEELAKLSVALLNCQSESEGRPLFECSEHMVRASGTV